MCGFGMDDVLFGLLLLLTRSVCLQYYYLYGRNMKFIDK